MSLYPKPPVEIGGASALTLHARTADTRVAVRPPLPGSVILVHGVNDVGVSYGDVERGLCAGLGERLGWVGEYRPASYRLPTRDDRGRLEVDPDAVFFKRHAAADTYSPVIPFYWGYREESGCYQPGSQTPHGQDVDRYGNRLDKDASKGGGPFGNATSTLVDMWNRGFGAGPDDLLDRLNRDPLHPLLKAPGRMYMVLAAERLAALVSMIRDYDAAETVSIVGHSQGCMLALLAQALLMQRGLRPADTLVLTHPPYSLVDDVPWTSRMSACFGGGTDKAMEGRYAAIEGRQTLDARLRTLAAIVQGVAATKRTAPEFHALGDPACQGVVSATWVADAPERDNRGKVYLYFCPEDMTVALENVQGIGWQGVPDVASGARLAPVRTRDAFGLSRETLQPQREERQPLKELGPGFFQRVFTARARRPASGQGAARPVLVGGAPPSDFALRVEGEDDHAHVAPGSATFSASHPSVDWPVAPTWLGVVPKPEALRREGIRSITGEQLKTPVAADMSAGATRLADGTLDGRHEAVDPIDAAISVTSRHGLDDVWRLLKEGPATSPPAMIVGQPSPNTAVYAGEVMSDDALIAQLDAELNAGVQQASQRRELVAVFRCLARDVKGRLSATGQLLVRARESADDARLREQQRGRMDRSFHGVIFGSAENHRRVTAYDLAIGQGHAPSRAEFNAYLCAVADWRVRYSKDSESSSSSQTSKVRLGILRWQNFIEKFGKYYNVEPEWRKQLIEGNCIYYSTGQLPQCLPVLPDDLPPGVVGETMLGQRIQPGKSNLADPAASSK